MKKVIVSALIMGLATLAAYTATAQTTVPKPPNAIDYSMFFLADVRDAPECQVSLDAQGRIDFGPSVTNPAQSCPDAFAWRIYIQAVSQLFWEDWATNDQTWPSDPWPRCTDTVSTNCCATLAVGDDNAKPQHCPVFPGPAAGVPAHQPHAPAKAHQVSLAEASASSGLGAWKDVPDALKNAVIGNKQVEVIYRNQAMLDYIFDNELYRVEGLKRVYDNFSRAVQAYAPHRASTPDPKVLRHASPPFLSKIDFPLSAIMIKTDWLDVELASQLGIDLSNNEPYITMNLAPNKPYILLSFHISTKDLPNWFWTTFEHVNNQGRCDWLGCNDSFGYTYTGPATEYPASTGLSAPANNYIPPNQLANVDNAGVTAFDLAKTYSGADQISASLDELFTHFQIGVAESNNSERPTPQDAAWRSYRLKGSQTNFVTSTGRSTRLGNSVTEAGFVNFSSCMTCHSRAGANAEGLPPLAIFSDELSDVGLPKSVSGIPNEAWFNVNAYWGVGGQGQALGINAVQTDFIWGFRNACPSERMSVGSSHCANVVK